jgi:ketol-acid reductoisomerase
MDQAEFGDGIAALKGKKSSNCWLWSSSLNQGLNMRDSGLDITRFVPRRLLKSISFMNADNGLQGMKI